ncbi:MAG: Dyp-type peroxidase, partial [Rhodospirillales bacterium]|nr:Dyp-type peroxidase [Acetobacter sp.]
MLTEKDTRVTSRCPFSSRRGFLAALGSMAAAPAALPLHAETAARDKGITLTGQGPGRTLIEPFHGSHQGGIMTPLQNHTFFGAFNLVTDNRNQVVNLLKAWTDAAARMTQGNTAQPLDAYGSGDEKPAGDSGEALGLAAARLTLTFGFGPGLFVKDGKNRYGLAKHRPEAFVDLPAFHGDQLIDERIGGDLSVQACADDP